MLLGLVLRVQDSNGHLLLSSLEGIPSPQPLPSLVKPLQVMGAIAGGRLGWLRDEEDGGMRHS